MVDPVLKTWITGFNQITRSILIFFKIKMILFWYIKKTVNELQPDLIGLTRLPDQLSRLTGFLTAFIFLQTRPSFSPSSSEYQVNLPYQVLKLCYLG